MVDLKTKIIMFGASNAGKSFISYAQNNNKYEILAIADNDIAKQNTYFYGYPVIAPEKILDFQYDFIMITSAFLLQIQEQLVNELRIDNSKIKAMPKSILSTKKSYRPFEDEKTMDLARNALLYVIDLFETHNIPYFIDHGTLLGIVRDGDIIPWDDDIDISIYSEDIDKIISCFKNNLINFPMNEELEWEGIISYKENGLCNSILLTFNCNNEIGIKCFPISITPNYFENGFAIQSVSYAPECFFKTAQYVLYMDRKITVPNNYEKYLDFHYGDWEKPKKDTSFLDMKNYKEPQIKDHKCIFS